MIQRKLGRILGVVLLLVGMMVLSACVGSYPLSPEDIWRILLGQSGDTMEARVFWQLRLPRVLMGVTAGAVMSLSGSVYQTIFRNPLASPDLTGVASGASLGAAGAIVLGTGGAVQLMLGAFVAGMLSVVLVLFLVRFSRFRQMSSYILAGIVVSSVADAGLMCLKVMADPERELAAIEFWTMGSLGAITAGKLFPNLLVMAVPFVLLLLFHRQAVMLSLGEEQARSMGLNPSLWRGIFLVLSTLMIAGLVSVTGTISFVGLIGPHIAFWIRRRRDRGYFLLSSAVGAVLVLTADMLARSLWKGAELPLSIFTVFLAVPILILLLRGRKGDFHGTAA